MERAEALFSQVDRNNDGDITEEEWVAACLQDQDMCAVLATNTGTENGGKVPNIFLAFTDFYFYCILRPATGWQGGRCCGPELLAARGEL